MQIPHEVGCAASPTAADFQLFPDDATAPTFADLAQAVYGAMLEHRSEESGEDGK